MDSPLIVDSNQSSNQSLTSQSAEQSTTQDQSKPVIKYVIIAFVVVIVLVVLYQGYCAWTASEDTPDEPAKVTTISKKVVECDDPDFDLEAELNDLRDKQKKILDKCSTL